MRALLSVFDKTGVVELAESLIGLGFHIVSTGGTLRQLSAAGVDVTAVADVTGFPELLDGRVKTLHPRIHAGLLARRDDTTHLDQLTEHGIPTIDLVVANLYPFGETVQDPRVAVEEAVEQIDVGGPAMIRAAAKNFAGVIVVTDPADYPLVINELRAGDITSERRRALAAKAFAHVAAYDAVVAQYLRGGDSDQTLFPEEFSLAGQRVRHLRYGENAHQRAVAYRRLQAGQADLGVLDAEQLAGKELSFNNLLDADAAWGIVQAFSEPTVAIVKHTIPCGLASRDALPEAFAAALAGDPVSAFGGIVALNRPVDEETAQRLADGFFEVIVAPGFSLAGRGILARKKQLRLLHMPESGSETGSRRRSWDIRLITGGFLVQDDDLEPDDSSTWRLLSNRSPSGVEWVDLRFAWEAVRHVKSNGIVLVKNRALIGVGSGQPNRLESVNIAARRAGENAHGATLASDAFFPFADGLEAAAAVGVTAVIQPGGSVRDEEVIEAANAAGMAMLFTGQRHFRH